MPIKPENKSRYPKDWNTVIRPAILERANHCCENCGVANYSLRDGKKIILTIAHLDHIPEHCDPSNLRAWCQKCHNSYDMPHRVETRRTSKINKNQICLGV